MRVLDWLSSNLGMAYQKVSEILADGSVYNEEIYQSLFNRRVACIKKGDAGQFGNRVIFFREEQRGAHTAVLGLRW